MSLLKQKLFRWKEKEKIPKTEWPELVGKVIRKFYYFLPVIMETKWLVKYEHSKN